MGKILFILNPVAGGGKAKAIVPIIEELMDKANRKYEIRLTKKPKEAIEIAEENGLIYDILVAVGGDGTVNEVARGLLNIKQGVLAIVPGGTGNDMAKSLGIDMDPRKALETLLEGQIKEIDIGRVNSHNFLNIASIGFDAEVVANNVNIKKRIRSGISYAVSVVYTLLNYKNKRVKIQIDGQSIEDELVLLAVGNGRYYGGGMKILPMAKVDDGVFHICLVSKVSKFILLLLFPTIFKGKHVRFKRYVHIYSGKNISIESESPLYLNIDGEISLADGLIRFDLGNEKLRVICKEI